METGNAQDLKEAFRRDGYVFLPGFLSPAEVGELNEQVKKFISGEVPVMPKELVFYEDRNDPATLKQLIDMQKYNAYFDVMLNNSKFKQIAEFLLDDAAIPKTLEYFNKPPKIGKPTPPHQDNYYFMLKPTEAVTMWLALEDVDAENGCVRYVTGSRTETAFDRTDGPRRSDFRRASRISGPKTIRPKPSLFPPNRVIC